MFSFLQKSTQPVHADKVWKTRQACLKGMITESMKIISQSGNPVIISWFDDRQQSLLDFLTHHAVPYKLMNAYFELNENNTIYILNAGLVSTSLHVDSLKAKQKTIVADGHYPLVDYENKIIEKLCSTDLKIPILYCMSLEDPLLRAFGPDNIISLLEKLGLDDDETLDHPMVQKAIERTREKISTAVSSEIRTNNESEWFMKNSMDLEHLTGNR